MGQADLLYRLQQIDDEIRKKKKRLADVVRLQSESEGLLQARRRASAAEAHHETWRTRQRDLNLELGSLNSKAERSEERLYSGRVKNPKELTDLQHEIESLTRRRGHLEDELLEAMIMVEEAQEEAQTATEALERTQAEWERSQQNLRQEQVELSQRLAELAVLRDNQLELIKPESLSAYQNAARRAGGVAVATLSNDRCQGCQVRVPANLIKAADEGGLVICDNCTRILYRI